MTALGVSLLIVGAILILVEAHVPTLGVLGGPGVVALGVGAVLAVLGLWAQDRAQAIRGQAQPRPEPEPSGRVDVERP